MKRSEINRIIWEAEAVFARFGVRLPPFASRSAAAWRSCPADEREIVDRGLGWDVTDFGSGRFGEIGLTLVTLRNGPAAAGVGEKSYAEKVMVVRAGQRTPAHFHHSKMEDIIVRNGGRLVVQLWNAGPDDGLDTSEVVVWTDGVRRRVAAGDWLVLHPGESVTLPPRLYHAFWGHPDDGAVVVGEVSKPNDDRADNRFLEAIPRFPEIEEDVPPYRWLVSDYARQLG